MPIIPGGYILLSRRVLASGIMEKPPLFFKVWVWLLLNAQHKDYGNLKKGQLFTSIPQIQDAMSHKIGYRIERPTKKQIYGILEWLRNPYEGDTEGDAKGPMIVTTKVTHGMLVSIVNYGLYQSPKNYEGNDESNDEGDAKGTRRERQGNNINKNDKNDKKKEIYTVDFEEFWSSYPKRLNNPKKDAYKPWNARLKEGIEPGQLIKAAQGYKRYCEHRGLESEHILQAKTFLGPAERWKGWDTWQPPSPQQTMGKDVPGGGVPNASAYKPVDPEAVRRWKELNKDEYM